jgi:hypothetical protein
MLEEARADALKEVSVNQTNADDRLIQLIKRKEKLLLKNE